MKTQKQTLKKILYPALWAVYTALLVYWLSGPTSWDIANPVLDWAEEALRMARTPDHYDAEKFHLGKVDEIMETGRSYTLPFHDDYQCGLIYSFESDGSFTTSVSDGHLSVVGTRHLETYQGTLTVKQKKYPDFQKPTHSPSRSRKNSMRSR
ncbi:MAG: hypothetical protein ACI32C_02665 [Candidatus Enteromonas sp.]